MISAETPDQKQEIESFLREGRFVQVIRHPASYKANREFYDELLMNTVYRKLEKGSGTALVLHGNFFLQEEICTALEQNNIKPVRYEYGGDDSALKFESHLGYLIRKEKPDFVLSVNMLGFDGSGILADMCWNSGIPVGIWFVDDPNPILLHQERFIKNNMAAFCWERSYLPELKKMPFSGVEYLPLATDPGMFSLKGGGKVTVATGFAGSSMGRKFLEGIAAKFLWNSKLEPLVHKCAQEFLADPSQDVGRLLEEVCGRNMINVPFSDKRNRTWLRSYIIHTASMMRRKQIIGSLVSSGIQTFGDPEGWRELCGSELRTNPDIDYRTQLAEVYGNIQVNINITSCQMSSAVNQRVFDIPVCGGFVINDRQDDLNEMFESDEVAVYASAEDLKEKTAFFLNHEKERENISGRARKRILGEHTYVKRTASMVKILSKG